MKKTLAIVLFGILAVVLIGFGIVSLTDKSSPTIEEHDPRTEKNDRPVTVTSSIFASSPEADITIPHSEIESETESGTESETESESEAGAEYAYAYAGFNPVYANLNVSDWRLILVNRNFILPEGYTPELANAVEGGFEDQKLDYRVAPYYNEMYKAAYEDGIHLVPISGYRSYERQERNFENKIDYYMDNGYSKVDATIEASTIILPPGTSEHNAGLAMDICSLEQNFEDTEEFEWLCENAADYGFILRYPEDKQDITQIIYEPWHWRYVGVEAAREMKASGQCLEEYLGVVS